MWTKHHKRLLQDRTFFSYAGHYQWKYHPINNIVLSNHAPCTPSRVLAPASSNLQPAQRHIVIPYDRHRSCSHLRKILFGLGQWHEGRFRQKGGAPVLVCVLDTNEVTKAANSIATLNGMQQPGHGLTHTWRRQELLRRSHVGPYSGPASPAEGNSRNDCFKKRPNAPSHAFQPRFIHCIMFGLMSLLPLGQLKSPYCRCKLSIYFYFELRRLKYSPTPLPALADNHSLALEQWSTPSVS